MKKSNKIKIINFVSIFFIVKWIIFNFRIFENNMLYYMYVLGIFIVIIHIAIAVWLFIDAKSKKQPPLVWSSLALFFGLIAVFIYYWRLIYLKTNQNK